MLKHIEIKKNKHTQRGVVCYKSTKVIINVKKIFKEKIHSVVSNPNINFKKQYQIRKSQKNI